MGCIEGDCVPENVRCYDFPWSMKFVTDHVQAIPQMIDWYRSGNFPIDKLVEYFDVS
jgi:hypothetical protein